MRAGQWSWSNTGCRGEVGEMECSGWGDGSSTELYCTTVGVGGGDRLRFRSAAGKTPAVSEPEAARGFVRAKSVTSLLGNDIISGI